MRPFQLNEFVNETILVPALSISIILPVETVDRVRYVSPVNAVMV